MPQTKTTMSEATVRTLRNAEYDFHCIHHDMGELAQRLELCKDSKRAPLASRRLKALQGALCQILGFMDAELYEVVALAEDLGPAPF